MSAPNPTPFPRTFWAANTTELFERAAYYAIASFMVPYLHENLGMSPTLATFLNGSLLWGMIYFLPILSGTIADQVGFRRSLLAAFVLLAGGYLGMGTLERLWPVLAGGAGGGRTDYTVPVVAAIVLIGMGGSIVKPCISGTVQKTAGDRKTLGFGIFYMVINIGSMMGRIVSYFVRTLVGIQAIFSTVATAASIVAFGIVAFVYREPGPGLVEPPPRRTLGQALAGMVLVLRSARFVFFLIVTAGFWFMYVQIYNLIPLYLRGVVDPNAPVEIYTLANPVMIVLFQLLVTRLTSRWSPLKGMITGVAVATLGMLLNLVPAFASGPALLGGRLPFAGLFIVLSIMAMAVGEMMASPRIYEYLGSIAPAGQEGLYLGYASLPVAIGSVVGSPVGGYLFETFAQRRADHALLWIIVSLSGVLSIAGLLLYNRFLVVRKGGVEPPQA